MSANHQPPLRIPEQSKNKIVYIDHLKVLLTALVIAHHAFVTYGAPGSWYYSEKTTSVPAAAAMTLFVAVNQSFFMGFFFFLSALFVPVSYQKKGAAVFVRDRFIRLGIPLLCYSFVLSPVMDYLVYRYGNGHDVTFLQFLSGYDGWFSVGVMWFAVALLLFTLIYIGVKSRSKSVPYVWKTPTVKSILLFGVMLAVVSFIVRLSFPVGWTLDPFGFQLGHFPQYIGVFIVGTIATDSRWLEKLDDLRYSKMKIIALCMIFIGFPLIFSYHIVLGSPLDWFTGGLHVEAVLFACWEQFTGICIMVALLVYGKRRLNAPSVFLAKMSRCAFAVYILHPLVLISLSLLLKSWSADPAIKVLVVAPLGIVCTFLLGNLVVKIPGVNKII